jgi:hypothetical protein
MARLRGSGFLAALASLAGVVALSGASLVAGDEHEENAVPVCLQAEEFIADGPFDVVAPAAGEDLTIVDLRWAAHEGCERFVIELAGPNNEVDHGTGELAFEFLRALGVVRVHLFEATGIDLEGEPAAAELDIAGELAIGAYAVRAAAGSLFVDLHIGDEAEAALTLLDEPARVVVDLRPGGGPMPVPAARGDLTVVLEPRNGALVDFPFIVRGYARHFEANVVVRFEQDGHPVGDETFTTGTDWTAAWGYFEFTVEEGPGGAFELLVGEYSAADGTWHGVTVELIGELEPGEHRHLVPALARDVEHQ